VNFYVRSQILFIHSAFVEYLGKTEIKFGRASDIYRLKAYDYLGGRPCIIFPLRLVCP
jgi:hypothetical protein